MTISAAALAPPSSLATPPSSLSSPPPAMRRSISVRCVTSSAAFRASSRAAAASTSALSRSRAASSSAAPIVTACSPSCCSSSAISPWRPAEAAASVAAFSSASASLSASPAICSFSWPPPSPAVSETWSLCKFSYTSVAAVVPLTTVTSRPQHLMPCPPLAAAVTASSFAKISGASDKANSTSTLFVLVKPLAALTLATETSPSRWHSRPSTSPEAVESPYSSMSNPVTQTICPTRAWIFFHAQVFTRAPICTCGHWSSETRANLRVPYPDAASLRMAKPKSSTGMEDPMIAVSLNSLPNLRASGSTLTSNAVPFSVFHRR